MVDPEFRAGRGEDVTWVGTFHVFTNEYYVADVFQLFIVFVRDFVVLTYEYWEAKRMLR